MYQKVPKCTKLPKRYERYQNGMKGTIYQRYQNLPKSTKMYRNVLSYKNGMKGNIY